MLGDGRDGLVCEGFPTLQCTAVQCHHHVWQRWPIKLANTLSHDVHKPKHTLTDGSPTARQLASLQRRTFFLCELALCARTVKLALSISTPCSAHCSNTAIKLGNVKLHVAFNQVQPSMHNWHDCRHLKAYNQQCKRKHNQFH